MRSSGFAPGWRALLATGVLLSSLSPARLLADEQAQPPPQWRWEGVERIIAFGDVHGDYEALHALLRFAEVIDDEDHWAAGTTHLVSLGDLLDRGPDSRRVMNLLMRLEEEAETAGGRVHVLIGNHEQMNLTGDLRYVADAEYAAFAGPEDDALREAALQRTRGAARDEEVLKALPAGFFAHRAAFTPKGRYGRWLLSRNVIAVLNDTAFVHGGLAPQPVTSPPSEWVPALRATLYEATQLRAEKSLQRADLLERDVIDLGTPEGLASLPPSAKSLRKPLKHVANGALFASTGPLWYRGNAACHPALEAPSLQRALDQLGVRRVAVGHTPQIDHRIRARLDGRVLLLDTGMLNRYYGGQPRALLLEQGQSPRVLSPDGEQDTLVHELPAVQAGRDQQTLTEVFGNGVLTSGDGKGNATLSHEGTHVQVKVLPLNNRERRRALAAYRMDQRLGLGFVPIVAERGDGRDGTLLQLAEGRWLSEVARKKDQRAIPNWCSEGHAFSLVRLFDALIGHARSADEIAYAQPGFAIRLTGHDDAFAATGTQLAAPDIPAEVAIALLERVDEDFQEKELAELLNRNQLRDLRVRRDALLRHYRAR